MKNDSYSHRYYHQILSKSNDNLKLIIVNNENDKKMIKNRNPGVDLVRVIAMFGIVLNHIIGFGGAIRKYNNYEKQLRILLILFSWHNNGFGLISGIIGYKTSKYSNLLYLWFCVFFYSVSIHYYFKRLRHNSKIKNKISIEFFPVIYNRYWYFSKYFGMYLFVPAINKAVAYLTQSELKVIVLSISTIFTIWHDYMNQKRDTFNMRGGHSVLWLLTLYIIGSYIGKYRIDYIGIKKYLFCFIVLFIFLLSCFLYIKNENNRNKKNYEEILLFFYKNLLNKKYDSFLKLIQSISITLLFLQIKYNKYIAKIISFFGPLTFAVYLIHMNHIFCENIIFNIFKNDKKDLNLSSLMILVIIKCFKVFFICCFIEYLRHILFKILKVKNIFIYIEKLIWKIMDKK
jgi:surface polysaccharide O-acyltransferase-like enzyme